MKKLYKNKFDKNRRDFLKTLGAAGISKGLLRASPLVGGMMLSRAAEAQTGPNKSVVCYVPGGAIYEYWEPRADFSLPSKTAQYEDVKNDCLFLRNMNHERGGHGVTPMLLNNKWGGDSYDVNIGKIIGADTPFRFVNLGTLSNGGGTMTSDSNSSVQFQDNPFAAFDRLFGNGGNNNAGGFSKSSVIDAHKEALSALQNKLGFHEKERLDKHLTGIEETERRLIALSGGSGSCNAGPAPSEFTLGNESFTRHAHLNADMLTLALSCNLTRSVSLAFGHNGGGHAIPELNYKGIYHQSIHGGQGGREYRHYQEMRAHMGGLSAYFIRKLKQEGILDETMYVEVSDMGNADKHSNENVPFLFAGAGSAIRKGNVRAGGPSYHNWHVLETAAAVLGAQQSPLYQNYGSGKIIPGVIA